MKNPVDARKAPAYLARPGRVVGLFFDIVSGEKGCAGGGARWALAACVSWISQVAFCECP